MITIVGSGRVGSTIAMNLVLREIDDIVLIDIIQGLPQGEALDLGHAAAKSGVDVSIVGANEYSAMKGSDLVIVSAGFPRRPGMTRIDLLTKNFSIAKDVAQKIAEFAPSCNLMMITNPLDVMTFVALKTTGFKHNKVFGMGGMLDSSRFEYLLAKAIGVSRESIQGLVIGEHGEFMVPLPKYSSVGGIPVSSLLGAEELRKAVEGTRKVAAEVISLKGATFYAPGFAVAEMAEAIVKDKKCVFPVSAYLQGEYGVSGIYIGVPVVLGKDGVEKVIELQLDEDERQTFMKGAEIIKKAISEIGL